MSTGATIALVAGGVAAAGLAAFVLLRKPAAPIAAAKAPNPSSSSAGSLIAQFGGSLISRLSGDAVNALEGKLSTWLA